MNLPASTHFDVFNGDADGLCALHQLRLSEPRTTCLISGVKRDHALLERVPARYGDSVTMLDLPLKANRSALLALLEHGVSIDFFDHHHATELPRHPRLQMKIDPRPDVCTSMLVNMHIEGRFRAWAVVGAFGDNMPASAEKMAASIGLDEGRTMLLKALGECLNYNAYGESETDLTIPPVGLYLRMAPYADPFSFLENEDIYVRLVQRLAADMEMAMDITPMLENARLIVIRLPDAAWARRVLGSHANRLIARQPGRACAVMVPNASGMLTVSLRIPAGYAVAANELARRYGGDGRATAGGINALPPEKVMHFIQNMQMALGPIGQ